METKLPLSLRRGVGGVGGVTGGGLRAPRLTCSQQSVLSAIDRFVKAVDNMDATVLVPSRLRDMTIGSPTGKHIKDPPAPLSTHASDLFAFYEMVKDVKNELLWGPSAVSSTSRLFPQQPSSSTPACHPPALPAAYRSTSDDGLGSAGSSDTDSDFESILTDQSSLLEHTSHLATAFRHHLQGLHAILHQLADSADYLAARYQEDVESPTL